MSQDKMSQDKMSPGQNVAVLKTGQYFAGQNVSWDKMSEDKMSHNRAIYVFCIVTELFAIWLFKVERAEHFLLNGCRINFARIHSMIGYGAIDVVKAEIVYV